MGLTQACSDAEFDDGQAPLNITNGEGAFDVGFPESDGLTVGNFDVDTSTEVYGNSVGTVNEHVNFYDDVYATNVVDFFAMISPGFDEVDEVVFQR